MISSSSVAARAVAEPTATEILEELRARDRLPGVALAVRRGGELVASEAVGWSHLDPPRALSPQSRFRIASISKSITSVALGLLFQEGALDLDAEVQRYVPGFPRKEHPITVRQLAGHLSGLPHYDAADMLNRRHYESVTEALGKFADRPLLLSPGERFSYSSFGWNLLAAVIEGASGRDYLAFVRDRVLRPLALERTGPDRDTAKDSRMRVGFYFVRPGSRTVVEAPAIDNSDAWASAGFLSTAEDLVRFGRGLMSGELLEERTRELLWTPMRTSSGESTGHGLGWEIGELRGRRVVGHGGSHVGATAQLVLVPDRKLAVALLANANSRHLRAAAARLVAHFLTSGEV